jgi:hypothetical protein
MSMYLSKACSKYGADMGRPNNHSTPDATLKFRLERIRLDSGGYDRGGAYWGIDLPLYRAEGDDAQPGFYPTIEHLRADNREHAKEKLRAMYPKARFYR